MATLAAGSSATVVIEVGQTLLITGECEVYRSAGRVEIVFATGRFGPYEITTNITIRAVGSVSYFIDGIDGEYSAKSLLTTAGDLSVGWQGRDGEEKLLAASSDVALNSIRTVMGGDYVADSLTPMAEVIEWSGNGSPRTLELNKRFDAVIVIPSSSTPAHFFHNFTWRGNSPNMGANAPHTAAAIRFYGETMYVSPTLNAAGVNYRAILLADNGSGRLKCGSYAGNGIDNRAIDIGIAPCFVMVKRDNSFPCWFRAAGMDTSYPLSAAASAANIKSLTPTGFTVGNSADINEASDGAGAGGEAYDYIALAESLAWEVTTFVGSGSNREIGSPPQTVAAIVKSLDNVTPRSARLGVIGSSITKPVGAAAEAALFTVGDGYISVGASSEVNGSGFATTVLSIKSGQNIAQYKEAPKEAKALKVGASGGAICLTNNPLFTAIKTSGFYIEALFKYDSSNPSNGYLVSLAQSATAGQMQFALWVSGANKDLMVSFGVAGATTKTLEIGVRLDDGEKHHVGLGFDGVSEMVVDVDGSRVKLLSSITTIVDAATPTNVKLGIGCLRSTADARAAPLLNSEIALVRLYSSTLTASAARRRYRRAMLQDFSARDVACLEEWDASQVDGSLWYSSRSSTNIATIGPSDTITKI